MIDSHCHLTDPRLFEQLDDVLPRAAAAGVHDCVTIATTPADAERAIALCASKPNVRCAIGVHPNHSHEVDEGAIERIRELAAHPSVVAIGEMGLDYHWDFADRALQRSFFTRQLALAAELDRPIVIHSRNAIDDTLALMTDLPAGGAVFHCFTGTAAEAAKIVERGFLLGFTGPVTYRKNDELREVARSIPLERLLIETDAPYLTPEPHRKQRINEPAMVRHVAACIARERGMTFDDLDAATTANTRRFYRMPG